MKGVLSLLINIMINSVRGKMGRSLVDFFDEIPEIKIIPFSLVGSESVEENFVTRGKSFQLISPSKREERILKVQDYFPNFIAVDFTDLESANGNTDFYVRNKIPFVMGTTGGDREEIVSLVKSSSISAVLAPNMCLQVVAIQAMMEYAIANFPGILDDFSLEVIESHHGSKKDFSGTAKEMIELFNGLGLVAEDGLHMVRDASKQEEMGVDKRFIESHAWHEYNINSQDGSIFLSLTHNINGRTPYLVGTLKALLFLDRKMKANNIGKVFSMIEVAQFINPH